MGVEHRERIIAAGWRGPTQTRSVGDLEPSFFGQAFPWLTGDEKHPESVHAWTFACVKKITDAVSSVPLRMEGDGRPIALFDKPNRVYSGNTLWRLWARNQMLDGEVIVVKVDRNWQPATVPAELWVVPIGEFVVWWRDPRGAESTTQTSGSVPVRYVHQLTGREFKSGQVIHHRPPEGAPLRAARLSVEADIGAARYSAAWTKNDLQPSGWFEMVTRLSDAQYKQLRQDIGSRYSGATNAGKFMLLDGGLKWTPNPQTMRDMQWMEGRAHWLEEICAAFGVPKTLLGVTDDLNYATHLGQLRVFWEGTIKPLLADIEGTLWSQYFEPAGGKTWARFELSTVPALQSDLDGRAQTASALIDIGVPPNAAYDRVSLGVKPVMGGDTSFLAGGRVPLADSAMTLDQVLGLPALADAPAAAAPVIGDAGPVNTVQDTAMNGAQVASLQAIVQSVADGSMPAISAVEMIVLAFPAVPRAQAETMVYAAVPTGAPATDTPTSEPDPVVDEVFAPTRFDRVRRGLQAMRRDVARVRAARSTWTATYKRVVQPSENRAAKVTHAVLHGMKRDILKHYDSAMARRALRADAAAFSFDESPWTKKLIKGLTPIYEQVIRATLKDDSTLGVIPMTDPRISAIVETRTGEYLVDVTRSTVDKVRETIGSGLDAGKTVGEIRRELSTLPDFSRERARLVATTEMGAANNQARAAQFDEFEVDEVMWVSLSDGKVRPSHVTAENAGSRVRGERFPNGLRYPHDPEGSAEEVIGCRCGLMKAFA